MNRAIPPCRECFAREKLVQLQLLDSDLSRDFLDRKATQA